MGPSSLWDIKAEMISIKKSQILQLNFVSFFSGHQPSHPVKSKYYFRPNPGLTLDLHLKISQNAIGPLRYCLKYLVLINFHLHSVDFIFETNREEKWMKQVARNVTMAGWGFLEDYKYLIHDRNTKFCRSFRAIIAPMGIKPIRLPPRVPKMNSFAERFVRLIKEESLNRLFFLDEESLRKTLSEYLSHYYEE